MANVRLTWTLPVPTANQRALKHVLIDARAAPSLPWGSAGNPVAVPTNFLLLTDVGAGTWEFRATVVDVANVSDPTGRTTSVTVGAPVLGPPSPVTTFTGVVE